MKLIPSCIRKILLYVEKYCVYEPDMFNEERLHMITLQELYEATELSKFDHTDIYYNVQKMYEGKLLTGNHKFTNCPDDFSQCQITGITYYGHEILDNLREEPIWTKTKKNIGQYRKSLVIYNFKNCY